MPFIDESGVSCGRVNCKNNEGLNMLTCKKWHELCLRFPLMLCPNYRTGRLYTPGVFIEECPYYEEDDGYTSMW
jgi:hypothetical protein